jgi:hypothetical protein
MSIHGVREDADRYFHCWNCGFVCDSQRDSLGDRTGVYTLGRLADEDGYPILDENGFDIYPEDSDEIISGCPFCGCGNYRG